MTKWGFIGCGSLSQALINGALKKKLIKPHSIFITNRTLSKSKSFSQKTKVKIAKDNQFLIENSDIIFIGTKPNDIIQILEQLKASEIKNKIVISLAEGVEGATLKKFCNKARAIIRVMANTPVTIQEGFFGVLCVKSNRSDKKKVLGFLANMGHPVLVKNDFQINVITAGVASGGGFVFSFMEEYEKWFRKKGLSPAQSREATVLTFLGTAALAKSEAKTSLADLRMKVTSKKGTTFAGLKALQQRRVGAGLKSGLDAAFKRSGEIAKSLRQSQK